MPDQQTYVTNPASLIQEQFWLINQLQPDNPAYNIPSLFHIKGNFNIDALTKSLDEIIRRHEIFRTTFSREGSQLYQKIANETQVAFQTIAPNNRPHEEQQKQIHQRILQEIRTPFDLAKGPLFRVFLFCISQQEHILLFVMHHIITDLHSKQLFSLELSKLYAAFTANKSADLPPQVQQYKNFAHHHQLWLNGEQSKVMADYWQRSLADCSGHLNLPTDHPRPPVQTISGKACPVHFSQAFTNDLKKFSRKRNANIFLTLLTAYYILLYRYTGQKDIITGVPFTNRREELHKEIMGCFVNILPIAVTVLPDQSFVDILQQVRRKMLQAHRNQELPYKLIVNNNQTRREASFNPLFQTGFTFEPPMPLVLHSMEVKAEKIHTQGAQLDLFFTLWEENNELHGFIEFNSNLFKKTTIHRLIGHYTTLLHAITVHPEKTINTLNILTEQERKLQLTQWNATDMPLPETPVLHTLFEAQVRKTPDAIALVHNNSKLTYQQLNNRANQLAHHLHVLGTSPGALVGIFIERSLNMVIAMYAILKAGGTYIPLDPSFPQDRIAFMLEDTDLKLILTERHISSQLPQHHSKRLFIDTAWSTIQNEPSSNPGINTEPDNLAYIIYTSGSTGKPKGVQVPHKAVVNFLVSMSREPGITGKDTLLAVTTLSFDISVLELFLPLTAGGKTVIAGRETVSNGEALLKLMQSSNATVMQATPTTWYLLIAAGWQGSKNFKVLCGGEPLPQDLVNKLTRRTPDVWNMYGPTETTVWSTCHKIAVADKEILVGKPIANTQIYIVNQNNQPNPVGIAGEMLIGGTGVTCGYLNSPELTQKNFIPDIFNKKTAHGKLYRTGDLACRLPDGSIKVAGRIDNQIKLHGYRIELGEIEVVLENHPTVNRAAVIVREDTPGDKRLTAYAVTDSGQTFSITELRRYLRTKLPEYMVPSAFIQVEAMPLTLNGKIDRSSLPQPEQKRHPAAEKIIEPTTETEKKVSRLWHRLLKTNQISTSDNFFDMGGNSLLSVQFVAMLKEEMCINLPIVKFYQYPTIKSLADFLSAQQAPRQQPLKKAQSRAVMQRKSLIQRRQVRKKE